METIDLHAAARISQADAKKLLDDDKAVFVDLRPEMIYDMFHLPGAVRLDLKDVVKHAKAVPTDKTIIYYCDCPNEETSARAVILAASRAGRTDTLAFVGTVEQWLDADYPFEQTAAPAGVS